MLQGDHCYPFIDRNKRRLYSGSAKDNLLKPDMHDRSSMTHSECSSVGLCALENPLDEPERESLLRLTRLVEHLFRVPVAYMALISSDMGVSSRIGSGEQFWDRLSRFPHSAASPDSMVWQSAGHSAAGQDACELRFVAVAPLQASNNLQLGVLVIGDTSERPDFGDTELATFSELAGVLARKMELRLMAAAKDSD